MSHQHNEFCRDVDDIYRELDARFPDRAKAERLSAAAPDLLAALKTTQAHLSLLLEGEEIPQWVKDNAKAIAQAEGSEA